MWKGTLVSWVCLAELDTSGDDAQAGRKAQARLEGSHPAEDSTAGLLKWAFSASRGLLAVKCSVLSWTKASQSVRQSVSQMVGQPASQPAKGEAASALVF